MQRAGQFTALGGSDARAAPGASDSGGGKGLDRSRWQRASQEVALRDSAAKIAAVVTDAMDKPLSCALVYLVLERLPRRLSARFRSATA